MLSTSISLGWECNEQNALFELQYKSVSSSTWTTITDIPSDGNGQGGNVSLTELLPNTTYQWRVKTICEVESPSAYIEGTNFTTVCPSPWALSNYSLLSTSISLGWECNEQNALFELQYKSVSSSTWTTITNIPSDGNGQGGNVSLTELLPNTTYKWRVKTICELGSPSAYVEGTNFTTVCPSPWALSNYNLLSTSISLGWECNEQNTLFELQYKSVSSSTWTTITNIQSDNNGYGGNVNLIGLSPNTTYQWRVKTICELGSPSAYIGGTNFTTICPMPWALSNYSVASTSISLGWECNEQNALFEVQYKPTNSSTWTTITNIQSDGNGYGGNVTLTELSPNTPYQWRVRTTCSSGSPSAYIGGTNFTTLCAAPTGLGTGNTTLTTTNLIWLSVSSGISYEIRYRVQGSNTAWTTQTVNAPTPTPNSTIIHPISGLTAQTSYEWQVRTLCSPLNTAFSSLNNFTTNCPLPTNLTTTDITSTSAKLNWNVGMSGVTSELQWRLTGSNTWTTISNIATTSYQLTGLTVGASYQWQVRVNCSQSVNSSYATPVSFSTICPLPNNLAISNLTATSAQLNWSGGYAGGTYSLQWRLQSNGSWTTVNNLTTSLYTLSGLNANTVYEWQVKLFCTPTVSTAYAGPSTFSTPTTCTNMFSIKDGAWNDPSIWSCNRLPTNADIVQIKHIVTVPAGYVAQAQQITYAQGPTVKFLQAAQLNFLH
ncbi:fibronectin type III domain-containing protein [Emticicia agri]|uniref:Fibronectin type III domain-containing protein n=1 Tax=Emticicia agri TaxID=2492393 RepID=A0A4Q5LZ81_9BACT|nr:fibronectin type III domain-containing protein [Emticicia agri]RYU95211.1 fibronectin type III domain-containing protein [Emticicia agri]